MRPGGIWISFNTVIAVTVLPQPELTDHAQCLAAIDREIDTVDRPHHAVVRAEVRLQPTDLEQRLSHGAGSEHSICGRQGCIKGAGS